MKCKPSHRTGVTLIELILVITILSVIFTGLFATYFTSLTITKTLSPDKGVENTLVLSAMGNIRDSIANVYFIPGNKRLIFIGEGASVSANRSDKLTFASSYPNSLVTKSPEIRETGFYLKPGNNSDYFVLVKREDEMVDEDPRNGGIEHSLLEYVISFRLQYSENGLKWEDDWDSIKRIKLPRLVKIMLTVNAEGREKAYETIAFPGLYFK